MMYITTGEVSHSAYFEDYILMYILVSPLAWKTGVVYSGAMT